MADVNIKIKIEAARAEAQLARFNAQTERAAQSVQQAQLRTQILNKRLINAANAGARAGRGLSVLNISFASFVGNLTSRAVTAGLNSLINGFGAIVQAGRDFEDGLVNIGKTTGIEGASLAKLGDNISKLAQEIPVATNNLLEIATVAGQLGFQSTEEIEQFTETLAKLQLATDITGEEGSRNVARILTVTGELEENGTENIEKFGNVITRLGNNFAATENEILRVATRVSQGTAAFGIASEDVLGIATALRATGAEAEASGTAIQKTFRLIGQATTEGGESLAQFAEAAGLSNEAFVELFQNDPAALFQQLAVNLGETGKSGADLNAILADLGLSDERLVRTLTPLISNYKVLESAISDARTEAVANVALNQEAAKAADTLSADLTQLSNAFDQLAKELFDEFGPALRAAVQGLTGFIQLLISNRGVIIGTITAITAAFGALWLGITGPAGIAIAALSTLSVSIGLFGDEVRRTEQETAEYQKTVEGLSEAYNELDNETQNYLNSLASVTGITREANGVEDTYNTTIDGVNQNLVERLDLNNQLIASNEAVTQSVRQVALFEQDKTQQLQKFFKDEEQARLNAKFVALETEKEKEAFTRFVVQQGQKRQQEAFASTIGLDRATVESERQKQAALQKLRQAQAQFEQQQAAEKLQREEQLRQANAEAALAEQQAQLLRQEGQIAFEDAEFARLTANLDRRAQAEIAAREANLQDEISKQQLLAEVRKRAADNEIAQRQRAQQQTVALEQQKQRATLGFAQAAGTALVQIAGGNNKALFALNKAFAAADIILRGLQGEALAVAQLGAFSAPAVAAIRTNTQIQLATLAATAIGQASSGNFEEGGIVPGNSFSGDKLTANVNSGEMILNRQQQRQLFNMANGQSGNGQQEIVVKSTIVLNEEVVGEAVSRQVANGLVLGEVQ